ncbi:dihydroorotase [Candidatus Sulfidibacterium hydrothermale]|uniref:dihydroorotase n=1 Tax=Candidatus Sulfidibacterium hydrothermale TaxID=2875962 RepID=UPI001F0A9650|nr:dihydroorotase [Candidatus Sulfidibacterium hydrothermale]UBM61853.1 dihydroorotase [Candidatus Sulfidibacterium hydrothermale]
MAAPFVIRQATVVNENQQFLADIYVENGKIKKIVSGKDPALDKNIEVISARGLYLLPGVIDDQVHFREPGLEYKADIFTESRAAVAGGITSYMEMPNTRPPVLTQKLLEEKYALAAEKSLANYSFYMGTSNDNLKEVLKTDPSRVCGIKIFMGSSTGNMLVDEEKTLEALFSEVPMLMATHCEDEAIIRKNYSAYYKKYGPDGAPWLHPKIRSAEACLRSSEKAARLARKYGSRLHILHLSTAAETALFDNHIPLKEKKITAEVCVHHLWFSDKDYAEKGNRMKWNPAVKTEADRDGLLQAVLENRIDVIATDHAPHTKEEKQRPYFKAPSGGPMVQHALPAMLELVKQKKISLEKVVEKMCHHPAILFRIKNRGFIRPGYAADLVLVDLNAPWEVNSSNILYKCRWSPLEGTRLHAQVISTFVNGNRVYHQGEINENIRGERLLFSTD